MLPYSLSPCVGGSIGCVFATEPPPWEVLDPIAPVFVLELCDVCVACALSTAGCFLKFWGLKVFSSTLVLWLLNTSNASSLVIPLSLAIVLKTLSLSEESKGLSNCILPLVKVFLYSKSLFGAWSNLYCFLSLSNLTISSLFPASTAFFLSSSICVLTCVKSKYA